MSEQSASVRATIPAHVTPSQVLDFDIFADRRYTEADRPHQALQRLAAEAGRGIFWSPYNGGHWFVSAHDLIFEATRQPEIFSSSGVASLPPMPPELEPWLPPLSLDAPEHMKYRMPLMHAFSPDRVKLLEKEIRAFAGELIDAFKQRGECEFVNALAEPLPIVIFMKLMGLDTARTKEFRSWVKMMPSPDVNERAQSHRYIRAMLDEVIAARRVSPRDDLISYLLSARIDGELPDDRQMHGMCMLLFAAGLDTVANSLSLSMEHLARHPELQDRLRREPHMIREAVEELLRVYTVTLAVRKVVEDTVFHGANLKNGDRVALALPLGNTDPKVFEDGGSFNLDRDFKTHLTFGAGPHRCAGSHLARLELAVFLEEWFERMPNVSIDARHPPEFRCSLVFAAETLNLLWSPPEGAAEM